jgi:Holliday junction resolvase RusA-like endonuclease
VVHGTPAPAGSKRVVPAGGRFRVIDASRKAEPWKKLVAQHAGEAMAGRSLLRGALAFRFAFFVRRPKGHFGKRGLRPSAPRYPTTRPDSSKLARGTEDALSGVVWGDDAQVVRQQVTKDYGPERVEITVWELEE